MMKEGPVVEGVLKALYAHYEHVAHAPRDGAGAIPSKKGFGRYVPEPSHVETARQMVEGGFEAFVARLREQERIIERRASP